MYWVDHCYHLWDNMIPSFSSLRSTMFIGSLLPSVVKELDCNSIQTTLRLSCKFLPFFEFTLLE